MIAVIRATLAELAGEAKKSEGQGQRAKTTLGTAPEVCGSGAMPRHSEFQRAILGVVVRVVVVTMMVFASGERGACNNQQQERGENELLHVMEISTILRWKCV
jgi:hypothetical protein